MNENQLTGNEVLTRPVNNSRNIANGVYNGEIVHSGILERKSSFTESGKCKVLNIKVQVRNSDGDIVDLYFAPHYSWSKMGRMFKVLEDLDMLPNPGESIALSDLVGIPVEVTVDNVENDRKVYSNIIDIKRIHISETSQTKYAQGYYSAFQSTVNKNTLNVAEGIQDYEELESIDEL